jgi:hypothetical protein
MAPSSVETCRFTLLIESWRNLSWRAGFPESNWINPLDIVDMDAVARQHRPMHSRRSTLLLTRRRCIDLVRVTSDRCPLS